MKTLNLSIVLLLMVFSSMLCASDKEYSDYLRPGDKVFSPNKRFVCWTEVVDDGGVALYLNDVTKKNRPVLLWKSIRSLGVEWSPNSKWLAVGDNYLAAERAILVFDLEQPSIPLIYQTPFSTTEQDMWFVRSWDGGQRKIKLERERRFSDQKYVVNIKLGSRSIKATLYLPRP